MIRKILVPLDGSSTAERVLPYVERIALATKAEVTILAALPVPEGWTQAEGPYDAEQEEDAARVYLESTLANLTGHGLNVESAIAQGEPAQRILQAAEKRGVDLIAMTTHGRSGLGRWVFGSIAEKLLHASAMPLLVVRPPHRDGAEEAVGKLDKILLPLDGSELSQAALPFAEELAKSLGASIFVFHAVAPPVLVYPGGEAIAMDPRILESMEAGAKSFVTNAAAAVAASGVRAEAAVIVGNAADSIIDAAKGQSIDLIVMSTHGRSGVGRWVMGSVADAVVRRTALPVVLIRPVQAKSGE